MRKRGRTTSTFKCYCVYIAAFERMCVTLDGARRSAILLAGCEFRHIVFSGSSATASGANPRVK